MRHKRSSLEERIYIQLVLLLFLYYNEKMVCLGIKQINMIFFCFEFPCISVKCSDKTRPSFHVIMPRAKIIAHTCTVYGNDIFVKDRIL